MVEVLLQIGAEVNARLEVISDERRNLIQRNSRNGAIIEMRTAGIALAMTDNIEPSVHR